MKDWLLFFVFVLWILSAFYLMQLDPAPIKPYKKGYEGRMYYQMNRRCKYS